MLFARATLGSIWLLSVLLLVSCVEDKDYGEANTLRPNVNRDVQLNSNDAVAEDSATKLDSLINLPFEPEENEFKISDVVQNGEDSATPGPKDRRLTVVLRFSKEDTEKLVDRLERRKKPFETEIEAETWFPAELKAKSDASGNQQLKGSGYGAEEFTKSPWLNGSLIRVSDTDYFILILQTS